MATRPTANTPRFSTSGTNTEPSSGKKAAGWTVNERVPAQWLNWLQWSSGEWIDYAARVFSGEAVTDLVINAANPSATVPVIDVTTSADSASATYKLLFRFAIGSTRHVSLYAGSSGSTRRWILVQNAVWNGSAWVCEATSAPAAGIALRGGASNDVLELMFHAATAGTWADGAWNVGGFTILTATQLHVTGTGPGASALFDGPVFIDDGLNVHTDIIASGTITASSALVADGPATFNAPATFNNAHLYLDDDVDIVHTSPNPTRKVQLPLLSGVPLHAGSISDSYDVANGYLHSGDGSDKFYEYPLFIPREVTSWNLEVLWMTQDSSHANAFAVFKQNRDLDTSASTPPAVTNMGSRTATVFSTTLAQYANLLTPITETVEPYNNSYFVRITIKGNAAGFNRLYAVRLVYADPGPRNG